MAFLRLTCFLILSSFKIFTVSGQSSACLPDQWQCDDGNCIPDVRRCDGDGDCLDVSDEMDCDGSPSCPPGHFPCLDTVGCVAASARCDGQKHCPTGSDEEDCPVTEDCLETDWTCGNRVCVLKELRCNGQDDCMDNSDEEDCVNCEENGVRCPDGRCLPAHERCDKTVQCSDGSDEPVTCGRACAVNNGGCSHVCVDEPWGAQCACPDGFKLSSNGAICIDVDECSLPFPPCMQLCTNTLGSFYCHCRGFQLPVLGNSTCQVTGNSTRLLTVQKRTIGLLDVKSRQLKSIDLLQFDPAALTFDIARGLYYWADEQGTLYKNDGQKTSIIYEGQWGIKSLACDWLTGNLFWTNQKQDSIYVMDVDGMSYTTVLTKNVSPKELVVLPVASTMSWINAGPGDRVAMEKSWLDGSSRETLAVLTGQAAHSLVADVAARRLYWVSEIKQSIESVKLDGSGRYSFMGLFNGNPPMGLAVFGNMFYWVDDKGMWQAPQSLPSQKKFLWESTQPVFTVFHELQQPQGTSACTNTCDICLLTEGNPAGFTCACPSTKVLLPDGVCQFPRFVYATISDIKLLEFRGSEVIDQQLFHSDDGILCFDVDWYREWIYWANRTGHVQRVRTAQRVTEIIPTPLPVCIITLDKMTGDLFWVSCDQKIMGTTNAKNGLPRQLYRTDKEIRNLYLDWLRGEILWLEDEQIMTMNIMGGEAKELLQLLAQTQTNIVFDLSANSLLWNLKNEGLTTLSLLNEKQHIAGRRWNISGSVMSAFEPFLLTLAGDTMTLWDRRDGNRVVGAPVKGEVLNVVPVLRDLILGPGDSFCKEPSMLCKGTSICLEHVRLCDGRLDCPAGDDEEFCRTACPSNDDFQCMDGRSCISKMLVCDGRSHCRDGSDEVNCPPPVPTGIRANAVKCRTGLKPCNDGLQCVLHIHVCDGETDCKDGSDELGCDATHAPTKVNGIPIPTTTHTTLPACLSPFVLCPQTSLYLCISPNKFCDGTKDCPNGFDEENCLKRCPSKDDFRCNDRRSCVSRSLVCDGRSHCHDGSDEVNCWSSTTPAPRPNVFRCYVGSRLCQDGTRCVLLSHVCDGEKDCPDGSDETHCGNTASITAENPTAEPSTVKQIFPSSTTPPCTSPSVLCPGTSVCIKPTQMCDGVKDCIDGSDEKCVRRCPHRDDFRCKDRRSCVSRDQVCDGGSHCNDGSDEVGCQSLTTPVPRTNALRCRLGSWLCRDGSECILHRHVCDGERDCQDGSDEGTCENTQDAVSDDTTSYVKPFNPPVTKLLCTGSSILCPDSSSCILLSQQCDGRNDCSDGSDENGCPEITRPASQEHFLTCRLGTRLCGDLSECVLNSHVCDGEKDCPDGSDERGCQESCERGEFQCAHGKMCIPEAQVCDGRTQCTDKSDELDCMNPSKSCEHRCADGNRCISKKFICDGEEDCIDGSDELGCDGVTDAPTPALVTYPAVCESPSVFCPGTSVCVSQKQICDGIQDCPDAFDESRCVDSCKNADEFLCSDQRWCISRKFVCDGLAQCFDGSDENRCEAVEPTTPPPSDSSTSSAPVKCRKAFKPCSDGLECVMHDHVCDGEKDCRDGSDEDGCVSVCKSGEFQCAHGNRCIPEQQVCNGENDCRDRSDEMNCKHLIDGCHHLCDNGTRCIPKSFICDGERDCADGSDEKKCGLIACAFDQYRCMSGQCVSEGLKCDGYSDCSDHSDEMHCARPPNCPSQLLCPNGHECLQREWRCDGEEDCDDGSDEENCVITPVKCREYQWQCGNSNQCIPLSWRCDGKRDCVNSVDEEHCSPEKCPAHLYQCDSGECLDPGLACNGITNCADMSDEGVGCKVHNCSSYFAPLCDQHCVSTPNGPKCLCREGYKLFSTRYCVDVDECEELPHAVCKHICINTPGSYTCHCHPGFYLDPDNKSCEAKDEALLLASVQSELLLLGVNSRTLRLFSSATRPVFSLDYHWSQQRVYWLSPDYQSVRWADMNSSKKGTLIQGVKADFIAVDWIGKNLYWVDGLAGQILAVQLSDVTVGSHNYTVVLGEDLEHPSSLVLLPHMGLIFWSEIGNRPQIRRSGMDGSSKRVVVNHGLSWPVSLASDLLDNRLYWADEKMCCIGSASFEGENVKILQMVETPSPFSVAVFNDRLTWSDTKRRTIRSSDKNTGKDQKVLLKRPGQPFGIKLMHPLSQPLIVNPCDKLRCSHLCLLVPARSVSGVPQSAAASAITEHSAVCRCPKGLLLSKDNITCSLPQESTFILLLSTNAVYQVYLRSMHRDGIGLKKTPNCSVLSIPGVTQASAMDLSQGQRLFVADGFQGAVEGFNLTGPWSRLRLKPTGRIFEQHDGSITAIAVDWVTSNLYWSCSDHRGIHVTSSSDRNTTLLLQGSLKATTAIAVHPPTGRLCYSTVSLGDKIQAEICCAGMDGLGKAVLWRKSSPTSLSFFNRGTMIYWNDPSDGKICSIGVDGSGYREFKTGPGSPISFTYVENILFWLSQDKGVTKLWFSDGQQPKQLWFETKNALEVIKSHSMDSQIGTNLCSGNNGGCAQLCLAYPGGRTCRCGRGFFSVNVTACFPMPTCAVGKQPCVDGSKCIGSELFCDGRVDCPDQSDERDCPGEDVSTSVTKLGKGGWQQGSADAVGHLESCGPEVCNGHGDCVVEAETRHCHCAAGYTGEFCQDTEGGHGHTAAILAVVCVIGALLGAAYVIVKRRIWESSWSRAPDKETLMDNMGLPCEHEMGFEELESQVDEKNPHFS